MLLGQTIATAVRKPCHPRSDTCRLYTLLLALERTRPTARSATYRDLLSAELAHGLTLYPLMHSTGPISHGVRSCSLNGVACRIRAVSHSIALPVPLGTSHDGLAACNQSVCTGYPAIC